MSSSRCPVCLWLLFFEGNGLVEVEEGDSKDTLACDDDALRVTFCVKDVSKKKTSLKDMRVHW